ncbi:MAG: hypothetical protein JNM56_06995 [Planctomycetia bacterium]|nr:hypothetical protein [Planctomycetia bacterium]
MEQFYYRGGKGLTPKRDEMRIDKTTGLVQPTRGISLNVNPAKFAVFGGAYRVKSIPPELEIVQQGNDPGHFELRPWQPMSQLQYLDLLGKVELEDSPTT